MLSLILSILSIIFGTLGMIYFYYLHVINYNSYMEIHDIVFFVSLFCLSIFFIALGLINI